MLEVNGVQRIITTPNPTTTVVYVTEAFPSAMRGQTYTSSQWGVYNRSIFYENGILYQCSYSGATKIVYADAIRDTNGRYLISSPNINLGNLFNIQWSNDLNYSGTKDTGLSRNAAGVLEVNNGTAGQYRDLILRDLTTSGGKLTYGANDSAGTGYRVVRVPNA